MSRVRELFPKRVLLLACAVLWRGVSPSAIGEHQESLRQKDAANTINGQAFNQESHHGDKLNENQNSLTENKNDQFVGVKDTGHYNNQDFNKKIYDDSKLRGGQSFNQDSGERSDGVASKKGHKKGHHNTGFRNSYHKDESSNNSSYFDDFNDEADQSNYQNGRGRYGNEDGHRYNTRKEDGLQHLQDNARQGNYDRSGGTGARNVDHRDYDRKRYQDDRRDLSQQQKAQNFAGRNRGYVHEEAAPQYHSPPYYNREYHPSGPVNHHRDYYEEQRALPPPLPLRRQDYDEPQHPTITIYEDPRIQDPYSGSGSLGQADRLRLDVRPGGRRYQRYDSYYETRPGWGGVNRRSDINPLVFNYNRY